MLFKKDFINKFEEQTKKILTLEQIIKEKDKTIQHLTNELKINANELLELQNEKKKLQNHIEQNDSEQKLWSQIDNDMPVVKTTVVSLKGDVSTIKQMVYKILTEINAKIIPNEELYRKMVEYLKQLSLKEDKIKPPEEIKHPEETIIKKEVKKIKPIKTHLPEEMKKDIVQLLQEKKTHSQIQKIILKKYNRRPSSGTISGIFTKINHDNELGKVIENDKVKWIKENTYQKEMKFYNNVIARISQELNIRKGKSFKGNQMIFLFRRILNSFDNKKVFPSMHRIRAHIHYFKIDGQISIKDGIYVINGSNLIPKLKKENIEIIEEEINTEKNDISFIDRLGM
jgi:hypothetical protein